MITVLDSPDPRHVPSTIAKLKAQGLKAAILYTNGRSPVKVAASSWGRAGRARSGPGRGGVGM